MTKLSDKEEDRRNSNLQAEYKEVCNNFRTLTEIRFKLLAFLPIGTALGVMLTWSKTQTLTGTLFGLFGFIVTSSVAFYNMRNDQLYNQLVSRAAELERYLKLKDGSFSHRPRAWRRAFLFPVQHSQIWGIYWASMIAWLFMILRTLLPKIPDYPSLLERYPLINNVSAELLEALLATAIITLAMLIVWHQGKKTSEQLKNAVKDSVEILTNIHMNNDPPKHEGWENLLKKVIIIAGKSEKQENLKKIEKSLLFYLSKDEQSFYWDCPSHDQLRRNGWKLCDKEAAQLIGLVANMPPRWIFDVASGRR